VEWDFLKAVGWVVLAAIAIWAAWGNPVGTIREIWDFFRGK
jgi:hypothetical protein